LIYSARPIPGNEAAIWRTINRLFRMGVNVIYDANTPHPVHVSGHAYQEELKMMINLTKPFYLAPVHGEPRHQKHYLDLGRRMGYPEHRLFTLMEGRPLCIDETHASFGDPVHCGRVLVDHAGNTGVSDDVLRERSNLARDGVVTVSIVIDTDLGELASDPMVLARGFNGEAKLLEIAGGVSRDHLNTLSPAELMDVDYARHQVSDVLKRFFYKRSGLKPLLIVTVVEI
jgi:ribonuclease J